MLSRRSESVCWSAKLRVLFPVAWGLVGSVLVLGTNDACAAALGSLLTSVGGFAALAALFVARGWQAELPSSVLPGAGGVLLVAGGAAWIWRARAVGRLRVVLPRPQPTSSRASSRPIDTTGVVLPAGLDSDALIADLRRHFMRLQDAWDAGEMPALQVLATADMLEELELGLPECVDARQQGRTEIVTLCADLFAFEELNGAFLASVEFSGLLRESAGQRAEPFRELWLLTKSKDLDSGWKLARHQALL